MGVLEGIGNKLTQFYEGVSQTGEGLIEGDWDKAKQGADKTDLFTPQDIKNKVNNYTGIGGPGTPPLDPSQLAANKELEEFKKGLGTGGTATATPAPVIGPHGLPVAQ